MVVITSYSIHYTKLYDIKNGIHTDLYDRVDIIPFDKIADFFGKNLK